jgi:hypothetical protein
VNMQRVQNEIYFSGMWLYNLDVVTNWPEYRCMDGHSHSLYGFPETSISFNVTNDLELRYWDDLANKSCYENFGILGKGWICHYCGDYNPSGCVTCLKCGGLAREAFVKPLQFDFVVSKISILFVKPGHMGERNDPLWASVELRSDSKHILEVLYTALLGGRSFFRANGYNLESGYYLCQYCGFGVREGEVCPGCGGKRMPYSEIVKVNRKCVYCGRESLGNLVCPGCGARIKGQTFKNALAALA